MEILVIMVLEVVEESAVVLVARVALVTVVVPVIMVLEVVEESTVIVVAMVALVNVVALVIKVLEVVEGSTSLEPGSPPPRANLNAKS